jgi:hypothetical protein
LTYTFIVYHHLFSTHLHATNKETCYTIPITPRGGSPPGAAWVVAPVGSHDPIEAHRRATRPSGRRPTSSPSSSCRSAAPFWLPPLPASAPPGSCVLILRSYLLSSALARGPPAPDHHRQTPRRARPPPQRARPPPAVPQRPRDSPARPPPPGAVAQSATA